MKPPKPKPVRFPLPSPVHFHHRPLPPGDALGLAKRVAETAFRWFAERCRMELEKVCPKCAWAAQNVETWSGREGETTWSQTGASMQSCLGACFGSPSRMMQSCSCRFTTPPHSPGAARRAIIPIVYGFPSAPLTAQYRKGSLVLTEAGLQRREVEGGVVRYMKPLVKGPLRGV